MHTPSKPYRILLAEDGSESARAAIHLIKELQIPPGSRIMTLAVVPLENASRSWPMHAVLDQSCELLKDLPLEVEPVIHCGIPAKVIIEHADRYQPDLIVMGAKGLRATLGILLGGVAQQVIEYANWPVLVVRATRPRLARAVLITDGSPYSQFTLEYLTGSDDRAAFPAPENMSLTVLHVLDPVFSPEMVAKSWPLGDQYLPAYYNPDIDKFWLHETELRGADLVDQTVERLKQAGIQSTGTLRRGDAATEILDFIENEDIDLVISGSRGLSQVTGWLLGSVSRKIVHYAACSALVVKTPADFGDKLSRHTETASA